jgi:hypothetical protein
MENNSSKDIAVFTFARGSQIHTHISESESYQFVERIINTMMTRSGVNTPKVGFGGTKEDVCSFIAGLIEYQIMFKINEEYIEGDTSDFDPDVNPKVYDDLG